MSRTVGRNRCPLAFPQNRFHLRYGPTIAIGNDSDRPAITQEPLCLGKPTDPGRSGSDNRVFLEAAQWIARTGSPWRDLPPMFGNWNTVFKRGIAIG